MLTQNPFSNPAPERLGTLSQCIRDRGISKAPGFHQPGTKRFSGGR